jgi:hypothetical protein
MPEQISDSLEMPVIDKYTRNVLCFMQKGSFYHLDFPLNAAT